MKYMTTIEAAKKWGISERRIRAMLDEGRVSGAIKVGRSWNIPFDAQKPYDKRRKIDYFKIISNVDAQVYVKIDKLNTKLNDSRPLSKNQLKNLKEAFNVEWTYNSNGIEGNTLTLRETQVVLEGITIGGKSLREHLEAINHEEAIKYLEELVKEKEPITEWNIKGIHSIIMRGIDNEIAGKYRNGPVKISGAKHVPPSHVLVPELMEKIIISYNSWKKYHPIAKAALLHAVLVKIHPFDDGNGRTARLIMNFSLMNDGYLPIIMKKENRLDYYKALDKAHTTDDYTDFINLICELEIESLENYIDMVSEENNAVASLRPIDFSKLENYIPLYEHLCYYYNEANRILNESNNSIAYSFEEYKKLYHLLKKEYSEYSKTKNSILIQKDHIYIQYVDNIRDAYAKQINVNSYKNLNSNLYDIQDYMHYDFHDLFNMDKKYLYNEGMIKKYLDKYCFVELKNRQIYCGFVTASVLKNDGGIDKIEIQCKEVPSKIVGVNEILKIRAL